MTWQNSQLLSRSRAPAGPRAKSPGAQVPSIRNRRLRPLGTRVAAAGQRGTGRALPLTPSGPAAPTAAPLGSRGTAPQGPVRPFSPFRTTQRGHQAAQTKGRAAPGAAGAETGPRLPPSHPLPLPAPAEPTAAAARPHRRPGASARDRPCRESGERPQHAGAEEGAAAATMSARPSQKRGAQRTKRGGSAGGAGGQADPADPRGIRGARSPGNPAP